MLELRSCKMNSLYTNGGKSRGLLGFLLLGTLASCVPPVRAEDYSSLGATASKLKEGDRLVSVPNGYFEFGIFRYNYSEWHDIALKWLGIYQRWHTNAVIITKFTILSKHHQKLTDPKYVAYFALVKSLAFAYCTRVTTPKYYLAIRYAPPIDQEFTWMSNRSTPLSSAAVLLFHPNGTLELSDPRQNIQRDNIWNTSTENKGVVSAQLLDTGKLVLKNQNGTELWNSFDNSLPTDTLLPGQGMNRSQGHKLVSMQRTGDPTILDANDTYSFGWDPKGVLALSWTYPKVFLNWKGGSYIPAPDVYAAHTIQNVDSVYFHKDLGHLYVYIDSYPPTAILSGGPDRVTDTTLKRIKLFPDGGLRILQFTINQTVTSNQTSNQGWKVVANWVVSDRPDSRSQCTAFGTCGLYSECVSPLDSLEPVTCRCPGSDNVATKGWFMPIDVTDMTQGCEIPSSSVRADCSNQNETHNGTINPVGMLELPGVDMPWGGDYQNLTGNLSVNCKEACMNDCYCAGAVYSAAEKMCWLENGVLFNLGYPTVALHGTDRTSYLRNQTVPIWKLPQPPAKEDNKLVKILVLAIGIPGALLIFGALIFYLRRNQMIPNCGSCFKRSVYEIKFPEDQEVPVKNETGSGVQTDGGRARTLVV